ncbi:feruloyl-CoA synthase [Henriciella mobilis]|uniref:AMP-dependent synthetase/ligase domain-containing protein n=1 Tax=Henriciella mobilis TaxID=2305467 RepID=A0A399R825_9PROT|nr:feruloyl-CoA synthase [Henriciella mobilis]RIJ26824.1 hypothetical protein D1223_17965 [Henriciella mobilis]
MAETDSKSVPFLPLNANEPLVEAVRRYGESDWLLYDPRPLGAPKNSIVDYLIYWAEHAPERPMLCARNKNGSWNHVTYSKMHSSASSFAQFLIDHEIGPGQRVVILSGNSIEHAIVALGAMMAGVTYAPISPAYALMPGGKPKLKSVFDAVRPSLIFAQNGRLFEGAIEENRTEKANIVCAEELPDGRRYQRLDQILETKATADVERAHKAVGPDTVAKILFSSGSTGWPKGVINTQKMLCTNMAMCDAMWSDEENYFPYETISWMPWNHTMAGNGLFNRSLRQGGTYYIDDGRPLPGEFSKTIANLREISPHSYSDVPAGYAMLTDAMEQDQDLRDSFFKNLRFVQYAGASLPLDVWRRFQKLSVKSLGMRMPFLTGYGCTETGPLITQLYWPVEGSGFIGIPVPGIELKLLKVDENRFEARARGPNVTPGYLGETELTENAFDEDGFYRTGDAVSFVDPRKMVKGLRFDSRIVEDFKLLSGTFVAVGTVRANVVSALSPYVSDIVVAGENRPHIGALIWLNEAACKRLVPENEQGVSAEELVNIPVVRKVITEKLLSYNEDNPASSTRIERAIILTEPPSSEHNEITDKGYINQRAVLNRRADDVKQLYAEGAAGSVISLSSAVEGIGQ